MKHMSSRIYLDYAAATPLDPLVKESMRAWDDVHFENAHSAHAGGREAKQALEDARFAIAGHLGVKAHECHMTNGATDALSRAILGSVTARLDRGASYTDMHIVISAIEHSAVRSCVEALTRRGVALSVVPVTAEGIIDCNRLRESLRDTTILVSVMLVNNELGTRQPLRDIAHIITERYASATFRPNLLVDASQAVATEHVLPHDIGADLLVIDAQKIYGPKRTGLLFVRSGISYISPCGTQGIRSHEGTPDVSRAIGLRCAIDRVAECRADDSQRWKDLKEYCVARLQERFPEVVINGSLEASAPNIINIAFPGHDGEYISARLDAVGIAVSAKSACLSADGEGSYVVQAIAPERARNALRISFGRETTTEEIDILASALSDIVKS